MAKVIIHEDETLAAAVARFNRYTDKDGIILDYRSHLYFQTKNEKARQKRYKARNRRRK